MKPLEDIVALNRLPKLLQSVDYRGSGGCWNWTAGKKALGYGAFVSHPNTVVKAAHVLFYEMRYGAVPNGLFIDHLCRNTSCVNPKHLEAVTCGENVLRGVGPTAMNARKTHCKRGHEFDYIRTNPPGRGCHQCDALRARERRAKKKGSI